MSLGFCLRILSMMAVVIACTISVHSNFAIIKDIVQRSRSSSNHVIPSTIANSHEDNNDQSQHGSNIKSPCPGYTAALLDTFRSKRESPAFLALLQSCFVDKFTTLEANNDNPKIEKRIYMMHVIIYDCIFVFKYIFCKLH